GVAPSRAQGAQGQQNAPEAVPIVFVGAAADGYKLTRPERNFSTGFRIDRSDASRSNLEVEIVVPPLGAPNTNPAPVTLLLDNQAITGTVKIPPEGAV